MTISKCYVWKWLPGETEPVVAGELRFDSEGRQAFAYGRSYLERENAEPIYAPELDLKSGTQEPVDGLDHFSCLRDAAPDAWGRRVIQASLLGRDDIDSGANLEEGVFLMHSASDRTGSLDFQESASEYVPREEDAASLDDLYDVVELVAQGMPIPRDLNAALFHGSAIGGARPKAVITDGEVKFVAKFSLSNDTHNMVKAEYVAMELAARVGLEVANVSLKKVAGKDVLLVERFDRVKVDGGWSRHSLVSGLTVLGLDEKWAREASYPELADCIRRDGVKFKKDARELFSRMVFNVLMGNTDDHARNHAFFVEGQSIQLSPAYDITPFPRAGGEASHAMKVFGENNLSRISLCIDTAVDFGLVKDEALAIVEGQIKKIADQFDGLCDEAKMDQATRNLLWRIAVLNPDIFNGGYEQMDPEHL